MGGLRSGTVTTRQRLRRCKLQTGTIHHIGHSGTRYDASPSAGHTSSRTVRSFPPTPRTNAVWHRTAVQADGSKVRSEPISAFGVRHSIRRDRGGVRTFAAFSNFFTSCLQNTHSLCVRPRAMNLTLEKTHATTDNSLNFLQPGH